MSNILGKKLTLTLFGESHGSSIGCVIDGLCAGIKIDEDFIKECLEKRRPKDNTETKRIEMDEYEIISGVFNGYSTGSSICVLIKNSNTSSKDYEINKDLARPGHADYVAYKKYHGFNDYRGGGSFSGRLTTPIVFAGSIALKLLEKFNIKIGSHIIKIGKITDSKFRDFETEIDLVNKKDFPTINDCELEMKKEIEQARNESDSIGGIIETAILNMPIGLGSPMFDSLESRLSSALFSLGGIKGIEFGLGFDFASIRGSKANDPFIVEDGKVKTSSNNNGGINGGISNGMPITFNVVVKPTPSIYQEQKTINMKTNEETIIKVVGRHDPCITRRINIVIRCITALVIADILVEKYGEEIFLKENL